MVRSAFFGPLALVLIGAFGFLTAAEGTANATVTEPNGLAVPGPSSVSTEIPLSTLFQQRNEAINWQTDAHSTPDIFSPLCDFTASLVLKQSGSNYAVGWYNVVANATNPPSALDIYTIVPVGSPVGTTISGATIRSDPHYAGGSIGFALLRGGSPPNYSESKWEPLCNAGACAAAPAHWILSVSYQSTVTTNAYYLGFEDGDTSNSSWNNDGDFNDYVFFFTGLACVGAGAPCTVPGVVGACAPGFTECDGTGTLVCKQVTKPGTEKCDGVDNDCNGSTDEGDICPSAKVCSKGVCVPRCGSSEFVCAPGTVCQGSLCVDPACANVTCPTGQVCSAGKCKEACDGVVCPANQVCRVGQCVDPCAGVTCDAGRVCESGVCVNSCACQACASNLTCSTSSGHCVDPLCANLTCTTGTRCLAGACVPACQGVVCPDGQACDQGACKDLPPNTTTDAGGGLVDPNADAGDASLGDDDAGVGDDDGGNGDAPPVDGVFAAGKKGCGCVVAGSDRDATPMLLLFGAVGVIVARRQSRKRRIKRS